MNAFSKSVLFAFLLSSFLLSCNEVGNKKKETKSTENFTSPEGYDLDNPIIIKLPLELDEISGVAYYLKDTAVFAIQDENGLLYKIFLNHPQDIEKWKYTKGADFEDLVLVDSVFYVLTSNGDITAIHFFEKDSMQKSTYKFPFGEGNEFEILYHDASNSKLRMICKDCESDKKKFLSTYLFEPTTNTYSEDSVKIDVKSIDRIINEKKTKFKPSAAAIHPITHELYIVSAINKMIVIVDEMGKAKAVHRIDKGNFKQPEGITFTPNGSMIISNEAADIGVANLMVFPYQSSNPTTP